MPYNPEFPHEEEKFYKWFHILIFIALLIGLLLFLDSDIGDLDTTDTDKELHMTNEQ
jgi:hypothetical protein